MTGATGTQGMPLSSEERVKLEYVNKELTEEGRESDLSFLIVRNVKPSFEITAKRQRFF